MESHFPKLTIESLNSNTLNLMFTNIHFSFLNTLRRIIKQDIPMLAINKIRFEKYSGYMNEEMLAHRLSLIPIVCKNIDKVSYEKNCICDVGCKFCNIDFSLEKKSSDHALNVYSNDLKLSNPNNEYGTEILQFVKNYHGILLCRLNPYEEIKLECTAVKGTAKQHAKFSASTVCFYKKRHHNSYSFTLETNENINPLDVFRLALEIFIKESMSLKKYINKSMTINNVNIKVPYQDTLLNSLQKEITETFEDKIDLFFYKKSHILSEYPHSELEFHFDDTDQSCLDVKEHVKTSINRLIIFSEMIISELNEKKLNIKIEGLQIKKRFVSN